MAARDDETWFASVCRFLQFFMRLGKACPGSWVLRFTDPVSVRWETHSPLKRGETALV